MIRCVKKKMCKVKAERVNGKCFGTHVGQVVISVRRFSSRLISNSCTESALVDIMQPVESSLKSTRDRKYFIEYGQGRTRVKISLELQEFSTELKSVMTFALALFPM